MTQITRQIALFGALCCGALAACGETEAPAADPCPPGLERGLLGCVDPARRYEPAERVDQNNVVDFGSTLSALHLPEPPRSGFRIVVPPVTLMPGQERTTCVSWPIPPTRDHVIYAARLYTTKGLHHSNVIAKPVDPNKGANPYPKCHPGASDPFKDLPQIIPDVLFGNSTQVTGEETMAFPKGMGFYLEPEREISTNIHFLNASAEPLRIEVAYDFFTMPLAQLETEVAPYQLSINNFLIHPGERQAVSATCPMYGGNLLTAMLHTHRLAEATRVERLRDNEPPLAFYDEGAFDESSRIRMYQPAIDLTVLDNLRYTCLFHNTTAQDITWGIGDNEMCVLFGYVYPAEKQFVGYSADVSQPCQSVQIGAFRKKR